jgi:hypothetical protein
MKIKGSTIFIILIVSFTFLFLSAQWVNLSNRDSGIDRLEKVYSSLKQKLYPGMQISYATNLPEGSEETELYFQSQFVLAPHILIKDAKNSFLLLIEKQGLPKQQVISMDTLWSNKMGDLAFYYLTHKAK